MAVPKIQAFTWYLVHVANLDNAIWDIADTRRGPYKRHEFGQVILPLTILRRLESALAKERRGALITAAVTGQLEV